MPISPKLIIRLALNPMIALSPYGHREYANFLDDIGDVGGLNGQSLTYIQGN
jgi:hypothetical protein